MVVSRNLDVGNVFAAVFCPDEPMLMAVGGSNGEPRIWDISSSSDVRQVFGDAMGAHAAAPRRGLIGLQNDNEQDDDESRDAIISEMYGAGGAPAGGDDASMASDSDSR
ncbi:rRNA-processing protein [Coemansia erecta]|nr:rRNA-processing protein [Coemansia erecta]